LELPNVLSANSLPVSRNALVISKDLQRWQHLRICVYIQLPEASLFLICAARFRCKSLNDELLKGPGFMNSLVGVLIQFREERVAIVSNIEAMFHQDRVDLMHHDALRFVW